MMQYKNKRRAFTLVEMMVAIAVFSIVMVVAMSALLNVIDANNKARSIKTAINNISFALEGISKDMRMGTDYKCIDNGNKETKCLPDGEGNIGVKYKTSRAGGEGFAYYKFDSNNNKIWSCLDTIGIDCANGDYFSALTSKEVKIEKMVFYVQNTVTNLGKQPRVIITIQGKAGPDNKPQLQTDFNLQTGISQRTVVKK
jgi:prepilin-type N-terminal cleavage/methylation domain-containing protein